MTKKSQKILKILLNNFVILLVLYIIQGCLSLFFYNEKVNCLLVVLVLLNPLFIGLGNFENVIVWISLFIVTDYLLIIVSNLITNNIVNITKEKILHLFHALIFLTIKVLLLAIGYWIYR